MSKGFKAGGLRVVRARGLHFIQLAGWERSFRRLARRLVEESTGGKRPAWDYLQRLEDEVACFLRWLHWHEATVGEVLERGLAGRLPCVSGIPCRRRTPAERAVVAEERAWSAGCRRSGDYGFAGVYGWAECAATDAAEVLWLQAGGSLDALTAPTVHELAHFARVA